MGSLLLVILQCSKETEQIAILLERQKLPQPSEQQSPCYMKMRPLLTSTIVSNRKLHLASRPQLQR